MRTIRHNGEYWYEDRRSLWLRVRNWFIWIGGWEKTNHRTGEHQWKPVTRWTDPFPLSLFGHRITFQSFGLRIRLGWRYFCWSYRKKPGYMYGPIGIGYAYLSRDGTPHSAHHWLWGIDKWYGAREILKQAKARQS